MAPGLNYGQQAFEGIKAFRHPSGQISVFRPERNAARMHRSAEFVCIPPVPDELCVESIKLAVAANAEFVPPAGTGAALYIRPMLFGSSAHLPLSAPDEYTFVVFVMPTGVYHGVSAVDALILEGFDRCAPEGTGSVKVGGNYAPVLRHSDQARKDGYGITLHLDSRTRTEIDEFSTSAFIGVKKEDGKVTIVQPNSKNVIESVTAVSVLEIAEKLLGYTVEKRRVPYDEIKEFNEVFAAGTAAALVPVRSITLKSRGEKIEFESGTHNEGGAICQKLLQTLQGIQNGEVEDKLSWNSIVERPPPGWVEGASSNHG